MTQLDDALEEIRKRAEDATPGPWTAHDNHGARYVSNGKDGRFAKFDNRICEASFGLHEPINKNMEFIANARADIPSLLRLVAVLRRQRNKWILSSDFSVKNQHKEEDQSALDAMKGEK